MPVDLTVKKADVDGVETTDKNKDRCYMYYTDIPGDVTKILVLYNVWAKENGGQEYKLFPVGVCRGVKV